MGYYAVSKGNESCIVEKNMEGKLLKKSMLQNSLYIGVQFWVTILVKNKLTWAYHA